MGMQGIPGRKGEKGIVIGIKDRGPVEFFDAKGEPGNNGSRGPTGLPGIKGDVGDRGPYGRAGFQGEKGNYGPPGRPGYPGGRGIDGIPGAKGDPAPIPKELLIGDRGLDGAK